MLSLTHLARNILLSTFLFDIDENEVDSIDCYAIFYEFYIEKSTYISIRYRAAKLIYLSQSMAVWNNCRYVEFFRIINTTTLTVLRRCWLQYLNRESSNAAKRTEFITRALKYTALKDSELFEIRSIRHATMSLLFIPGLYLDHSTNSIVAEAYMPLLSAKHNS